MNTTNTHLELVHNQPTQPESRINSKAKVGTILAPLALAATAFMFAHGANKNTVSSERAVPSATPIERTVDVSGYPRLVETVQPGQGAENIGKEVDPGAYAGPRSSEATAKAIDAFITHQAPNGVLQPGEPVAVPEIPGMQQEAEK